ncbi:cystathionine beta-lyase [Aminobacter niigataensis]|uniref:Cystathionine beta-lyase n=1 Tax=Aminobacter niigataensis TaxID=83265 RepID=A0ABR6KX79_9HYPH|nr:cystathionine beta-lyase [Aminobacter niigataensis]MBB4648539.1 cystathionine beta-lyase [Aminobacter niigataensis]
MRDETRLLHTAVDEQPFNALTPAVHRGSTIVFPTVESFLARHTQFYDGYSYGLYGHPASRNLATQIAALEGGARSLIVPSGMAAIMVTNLALLRAGDHVLLPDAVYGPSRSSAEKFMSGLGVDATFYDPLIGAGITALMRPNTKLVWVELPASFTMEVQDLPAIAKAAHAHGALVAADGTWASPLGFKALHHGADIAVQALSKHIGGHSDLLLGSATVASEELYRRIKDASRFLGLGVSPDDCFLALRGLGTLAARLERQSTAALKIAERIAEHPSVARVLYPPLPGDPGHAIWQRDFRGASGVFSVVLQPRDDRHLSTFIEQLRLFRIGASWGGLHSLVAPVQLEGARTVSPWREEGPLVRFSIGLEHPDDLLEDIELGLDRYGFHREAAAE